MATAPQQISGIAELNRAPAEWFNLLIRKESSSSNTTAQKKPNGVASPDEHNSSIEDSFAAHRGRSCTQQQRHSPRTPSHLRPKSRIHSPVAPTGLTYGSGPVSRLGLDGSVQRFARHSPSRTELAESTVSQPRGACGFSREDYKHYQIMGWLEADVRSSQKSD